MQKQRFFSSLLHIAIPAFVGFVGIILFEIADTFWIGKLGAESVAAVGAASFLQWTLFALMHSTNIGVATLVAQLKGAQQLKQARELIIDITYLLFLFSIIFVLFFLYLDMRVFLWMGLPLSTAKLAYEYFFYIIIGIPILYYFSMQGHIFNAHGDTKISNIIMTITLGVNIVLDPFFIFGWEPFPKLGIGGAALVTIIGQLLGVFLRAYYLHKKKYVASPIEYLNWWRFRFTYWKKVLRIGVPVSVSSLVWTLVFPILTILITKFGTAPLAGINIGHRFEGVPYFFAEAMAIAVSSLVGQSVGAQQFSLINGIKRDGLLLVSFFLGIISVVFIIFPTSLAALLITDPEVVQEAGEYLKIVGYFEIFLGWEMVLEGAYNGLGDSAIQMIIRVPLTLLRIPLAYYFAYHLEWGITGVWWAISISTMLKGIILYLFFNYHITKRYRLLI